MPENIARVNRRGHCRSCTERVALRRIELHSDGMFSIEHEFDSTIITLVDEGDKPLQEDVVINSFAECVTLEQFDPRTEQTLRITLSPEQVRDLAAALDLPEGVYQIRESQT